MLFMLAFMNSILIRPFHLYVTRNKYCWNETLVLASLYYNSCQALCPWKFSDGVTACPNSGRSLGQPGLLIGRLPSEQPETTLPIIYKIYLATLYSYYVKIFFFKLHIFVLTLITERTNIFNFLFIFLIKQGKLGLY